MSFLLNWTSRHLFGLLCFISCCKTKNKTSYWFSMDENYSQILSGIRYHSISICNYKISAWFLHKLIKYYLHFFRRTCWYFYHTSRLRRLEAAFYVQIPVTNKPSNHDICVLVPANSLTLILPLHRFFIESNNQHHWRTDCIPKSASFLPYPKIEHRSPA